MAKYELTEEQLQSIITNATTAAVTAALKSREGAPPKTEDERLAELVHQYSGAHRALPREKRVPCISHETNATFTARVVESKASPNGRIIDLLDYKHPAGTDKHQADGGLVPDHMQIARPDNGYQTPQYKQWLWETFWRADLRYYIGKPLVTHYRVDPAAPLEDWVDQTPAPAKEAAE